jgi:predicted DNA-binding transcriptional regulator AlpA
MPHHLVGVAEVAALLGVTKQRVTQLAEKPDFPKPTVRLAAGPIWERADVEAWARETGRI